MSENFDTIDQMVEELTKEMNKISDTIENKKFNRAKHLVALFKKELEEKN